LTYDVPEAGRLLGLSRNGAYAAAKAGLIPVLNIGRRMLVPKAALHRMLANAGAGQSAGEIIASLGSCSSGEGGPET
jgi:excisionase family DNA binding protein